METALIILVIGCVLLAVIGSFGARAAYKQGIEEGRLEASTAHVELLAKQMGYRGAADQGEGE